MPGEAGGTVVLEVKENHRHTEDRLSVTRLRSYLANDLHFSF